MQPKYEAANVNSRLHQQSLFKNVLTKSPGFRGLQLENVAYKSCTLKVKINKKHITLASKNFFCSPKSGPALESQLYY